MFLLKPYHSKVSTEKQNFASNLADKSLASSLKVLATPMFEPYENGQKKLRIVHPEFRDPGKIFGIFLEILVRKRTELGWNEGEM